MLINYIKAALASWYRRKVFTSLTILAMALSIILTTSAATYWTLLNSPMAPETRKAQLRIVKPEIWNTEENKKLWDGQLKRVMPDSWKSYDNTQFGAEKYTIFQESMYMEGFANHYRIELSPTPTDEHFFEVFDFNFISGMDYANKQITDEGIPAVVVRKTAEKLFGTVQCIGNTFTSSGLKFIVVGVVDEPGPWSLFFGSDLFMLKNYSKKPANANTAFIVANSNGEDFLNRRLEQLAKEYSASVDNHIISLVPKKFLKTYGNIYGLEMLFEAQFIVPIFILIVLLPLVCMVNLFRSMVMERQAELGIRKSFGAHAWHITFQFITECMLIILIAGLLAMGFSILFWKFLLEVNYMLVISEIFAWRVLAFSTVLFLFTGVLVGYFSSMKMAKGSIVKYLSLNPS